MNYEERIQFFKQQSFEYKKEQVFSMLEKIQHKHEILQELYVNLKNLRQIPDDLLVEVYTSILNLERIVLDKNKTQALEKLASVNDWIKHLREQEAQDRLLERPDENLEEALRNL